MTIPPFCFELFVLALGIFLLLMETFSEKQDRKIFAIVGIAGLFVVFLLLQMSGPVPTGMASYVADSPAIFLTIARASCILSAEASEAATAE